MSLRVRACTRVRVLCMINYRVHTFTILHDRRIPKVRVGVGVGPVEFKLYGTRLFTNGAENGGMRCYGYRSVE